MAKYLPLPNGNSLKVPNDMNYDEAMALAHQRFPDLFAEPSTAEGGFTPALKSGLSSLKSDIATLGGRVGAINPETAEKYIKEQEEYRAKTFKPTTEGWSEAPFTKIKELAGQSVPYMAAPVAAGFVAPAGLATLAATGAVSATQFTGSNLARQMQEGKKLKDTELGAAALASIPQAAFDVFGLKMIPGVRNIFSQAGIKLTSDQAKKIAEQGLVKTVGDYALKTGQTMGTEGLTEAGQQVFERLQAGLNITDEKARQEYFDSFVGGAVLGGVLAPAGRYVERGQAKDKYAADIAEQKKADFKVKTEAAALQKQQDEEAKATPEYARKTIEEFEALNKQFQDLKTPKPPTDSPFDVRDEYNEKQRQRKELGKTLSEMAGDYRKAKALMAPILAQEAEQKRLGNMSPEEIMMETQGIKTPEPTPPTTTMPQQQAPRRKGELGTLGGIAPETEVENIELVDYAKGQIEAARNVGQFGLDDYAQYLMQDPTKAAEMVKTRTKMPDLKTSENNALLSALKLQLQAKEKEAQQASKAELAQRQEDLKGQTTTSEQGQMDMFQESEADVEYLRRTGETNFDYLDPIFEQATNKEPVIAVNPTIKPPLNPKAVTAEKQKIDELLAQKETADNDYVAAKRAGEKDAAARAYERGNVAQQQIDQYAREGSIHAREVVAARERQQQALDSMENALDQIKENRVLGKEKTRRFDPETGQYVEEFVPYGEGVSATTAKELANKAERERGIYISSVLQEAAATRRAQGLPAITQDEAIKAASALHDALSEWITRVQAAPRRENLAEVITQPARVRSGVTIEGAKTDLRDTRPLEKRRFGAYDKAVQVIKEEIEGIRKQLSTATRQVTRETPLLKTQFATAEAKKTAEAKGETATTLGGELRRRTEFVRDKMAKMGGMRPAARDMLNQAADIMDEGKASRELLDAVEAVVDAINARQNITQTDIRAIKDAIAATKPTAIEQKETGQKTLFPEIEKDLGYIRATPANFANSPRIKPVWAAINAAKTLKNKIEKKQKTIKENKERAFAALKAIEKQIEDIKKNNKYFLLHPGDFKITPYTDTQIAELYAERPDLGETLDEKKLMQKAASNHIKLTPEEAKEVSKITTRHIERKEEFQKRVNEALKMLAQEIPLRSAENKLVEFMQSSNAAIKKQAQAQKQALGDMLKILEKIKKDFKGNPVYSAQEKAIINIESKVAEQRGDYQTAVDRAMQKARAEINQTVAELLDPEIERVSKELEKAQTILEKEQAELDKTNVALLNVLSQEEGANRTELATYEMFKYEEKSAIIKDLEAQIKEQTENLEDLVAAKVEEVDGAEVVAQAMLDENVVNERKYLEMLEEQMAFLKGEKVTAKPVGGGPVRSTGLGTIPYPFAMRLVEKKAKAQQAVVKTAEKKADDFKKDTEKNKNSLKNLPGITSKKLTPHKDDEKYLTNLDKQIAELEEKAVELRGDIIKKPTKAKKAELAKVRDDIADYAKMRNNLLKETAPVVNEELDSLVKRQQEILKVEQAQIENQNKQELLALQLASIDDDLEQTILDFAGISGPDTGNELKKLIDAEDTSKKNKAYYEKKLSILNRITSLEAQRDTLLGEKPQRRQGPATTLSTAALTAVKEFRTGSAEQVSRRKGLSPEEKADKAYDKEQARIAKYKQGKGVSEFEDTGFDTRELNLGGFFEDPEFSLGKPKQGSTKQSLEKELDFAFGEKITGRDKEAQPSSVLQVFNTVQDYLDTLPKSKSPKSKAIIPSDAKGFVEKGRAILFAENITPGQGLGVLLHEVGVHIGFRNFFSKGEYEALVNVVKGWAKRTDGSFEEKVGKAAMARVREASTPNHQIDDELLAYAVEEASIAGIEPEGVKGGKAVSNWLKRLVAAFKSALVRFGLSPKQLTVGDLVNFAYGAANLELKGTWHGTASKFIAFDFAYMGTGEGNQAYGWGTYRAQIKGTGKHYVNTALRSQKRDWRKRPEIQQWEESLKTTYDGKDATAIKEMGYIRFGGKSGISFLASQPQMPEGAANILSSALRNDSDNRVDTDFPIFSPRKSVEDEIKNDLKIYANLGISRNDPAYEKKFRDKAETIKWFKDTFDASKIEGIHDEPLYQGYDSLDSFTSNNDKTNFASDVLDNLKKDVSTESFDVKIKNAIEETKKTLERLIRLFGENSTTDLSIKAKVKLEEAKTFDPKQIIFKQKSAPPIPEPEGYLIRTLHTRPENHYLLWNAPLGGQSTYIENRIAKAYDNLSLAKKKLFDRSIGMNLKSPKGRDVYNAFSRAYGTNDSSDKKASIALFKEEIAGIKFFDGDSRYKNVNTFNYVDFGDKEEGADIVGYNLEPIGEAEGKLFSRKPAYETESALTDLADRVIANPKTFKERMGNNLALEAEMQIVDMRAGVREAMKRGAEELGDTSLFTQAMYNVQKADQYMPMVSTSLNKGPLKLYTDEKGFHGVGSSNEHSAQAVFEAVAKIPAKNSEGKFAIASTYLIAKRANNKGLKKLDLGELGLTQADLDAALAAAEADPVMKEALEGVSRAYNAYNKGMINFLAETGAIPKKVAEELLKEGDYVPYYRVRGDGTAELVYGGERTITVGDIRYQPYLHELKGGENKILPLNESIPRNTMLLTKKALYNLSTKNIAYAMQKFGEGRGEIDPRTGKAKNSMPIHSGKGPAGPDIIRFNQEPNPKDPSDHGDRWQRINTRNTAMEGIPSELVVKSLEGAHLTLPAFLKIGGMAGDLLRKGVTRMPPYILRQLIRDPMAATFTGGLNYNPLTAVLKAGKEFVKLTRDESETGAKLIEKGLIQSGIFTGDPSDLSLFALQLASGKDQSAIDKVCAMADRAAMRADAATKVLIYENAIKNGLSEVEADSMVMESINFYKRGLSPTVQYANRLIPFFNAQIQGLNVLYKAARGQMPFEEQQRIKRKFFNNAMLLMATGLVYALAMEDDPYFKNAKPRDKYSNFFLHLPGVEEPMKIPLPYEAGWFFSVSVAVMDSMKKETDGAKQLQALKDMFLNAVPGYTSAFMPQALKPVFEVWTNKNFFTGQTIESPSMDKKRVEDRYLATTTEFAKGFSKMFPVMSPIQIEHITRAYLGTLPIVGMAAAGSLFGKKATPQPEARMSEAPLIGQMFQRKFGGADQDVAYTLANEIIQTKNSFNELKKTGSPEDIREFVTDHRAELSAAPLAKLYQTNMGRLRQQVDIIRERANLSPQEKRQRLAQLDEARQQLSNQFGKNMKAVESRG